MQTASFSEQLSPIEWGPLLNSTFSSILAPFASRKIAILVDENTHDHCLEFLITGFDALAEAEVIMLPAGRRRKQSARSLFSGLGNPHRSWFWSPRPPHQFRRRHGYWPRRFCGICLQTRPGFHQYTYKFAWYGRCGGWRQNRYRFSRL